MPQMPRASVRRAAIVGVGVALVAGLLDRGAGLDGRAARADQVQVPPRGAAVRRGEAHAEGTGGWWLGTAGIALALAVCGGLRLASRRGWPPVHAAGVLRVVGRTSLSPRHAVYLLSVGDRVLIVGTGPQGSPSLLGELTDPEDLRRLVPRQAEDPSGGDR